MKALLLVALLCFPSYGRELGLTVEPAMKAPRPTPCTDGKIESDDLECSETEPCPKNKSSCELGACTDCCRIADKEYCTSPCRWDKTSTECRNADMALCPAKVKRNSINDWN